MKKICIWGTSLKKVADEAQILAAIQAVKNHFESSRITIFAQYGSYIKRYYNDVVTFPTSNMKKVITELSRCDVFIIVGGPFMEYRQQMISCTFLILICKLLNKPIITFGTTLFDYKTPFGKLLYGFLFKRLDYITVREELCVNILANLGIKKNIFLFPDPRYTLQPSNQENIQKILFDEKVDISKTVIGITTRHLHSNIPEWVKRSHGYSDEAADKVYEVLGKTIDADTNYHEFIIIPMHPTYDDDRATYERIRKYMSDPNRLNILSREYRSLDLLGIIKTCKILVSSRLGSSIFAAATSTPHISIAYEPRMIDHMGKVGLRDYVVDWRNMEFGKFSVMFKEALVNYDKLKENLHEKTVNLKSKAFQIINVMDN